MNINQLELIDFLMEVESLYGYNFVSYNHNTLKRRISSHAIKLRVSSFEEYSRLVLSNKKYFKGMFGYFSINVTEFFREPKQLKIFRENMLEYLKTYSHIKIWYAGCSTGETVYSLAMLLDEMGLLNRVQIYATDFNNKVLVKAKEGLYELNDFGQIKDNYELSGGRYSFDKYFIKQGKYLQIKSYLKNHILFFNHNLTTDGIINEFNLVICKNVFIYFNTDLKQKVLNLFLDSLKTKGFLILGENEYLNKGFEKTLKNYIPNSKIYQKRLQKEERITCK